MASYVTNAQAYGAYGDHVYDTTNAASTPVKLSTVESTGRSYDTARTSGADETLLGDEGYNKVQQYKQAFADAQTAYNAAKASGDTAGMSKYQSAMDAAHAGAEAERAKAGYSGGADGSQYYVTQSTPSYTDSSPSYRDSGSSYDSSAYSRDDYDRSSYRTSRSSGYETPKYSYISAPSTPKYSAIAAPDVPAWSAIAAPEALSAPVYQAQGLDSLPQAKLDVTGKYRADTAEMKSLLEQWKTAATQQQYNAADYNVRQAALQLQRALEDAQPQFKEQQETIARDERQGMDNAALYAELRGDRGGIGQSQYNEVQAAAAKNRQTVQTAQVKLSTDTARQIEDLRAQGEFQKADAALQISQKYLAQLMSLEQWAKEYNLSADQFEASLQQWQANYDAAMAQFKIETQLSYDQLNAANRLSYDQLNANTRYNYDALNSANKLSYDQLGLTTKYNYDALNSSNKLAYDQLGLDTKYKYDALNSGNRLAYDQLAQNQAQFNSNLDYNYDQLAQNQAQFDSSLNFDYAQLAQNQTQFNASQAQNQNQFNSNLAYNYANLAQNQSQFNSSLGLSYAQLAQNQAQFNAGNTLDWAQLMGSTSSGELTLSGKNQLASLGQAMLSSGIMPSAEQLTAMGVSQSQAQQYINAQQLAKTAKSSGGGSGSKTPVADDDDIVTKMLSFGNDSLAYQYLVKLGYTNTQTERFYDLYEQQKKEQAAALTTTGGTTASGESFDALYTEITHSNPGAASSNAYAYFEAKIRAALEAGTITAAEAIRLTGMLGVHAD